MQRCCSKKKFCQFAIEKDTHNKELSNTYWASCTGDRGWEPSPLATSDKVTGDIGYRVIGIVTSTALELPLPVVDLEAKPEPVLESVGRFSTFHLRSLFDGLLVALVGVVLLLRTSATVIEIAAFFLFKVSISVMGKIGPELVVVGDVVMLVNVDKRANEASQRLTKASTSRIFSYDGLAFGKDGRLIIVFLSVLILLLIFSL